MPYPHPQLLNEKITVSPHTFPGLKTNTFGGPNALMKPRKVVRRVDNIGEEDTGTTKTEEVVKKIKKLVHQSARDYRLSEVRDYIASSLSIMIGKDTRRVDPNDVKLLKYLATVGQYLGKSSTTIRSNAELQKVIKVLALTLQGK